MCVCVCFHQFFPSKNKGNFTIEIINSEKENNQSKGDDGARCEISELVKRRPESTVPYKNVNAHLPE